MTDDAKTTFGRRLRTLRKMRGLTLEQLGKASNIGFKHIAQVEKAQKAPSFEAIDKLAAALSVQPYELFLPYEGDGAALDQAFKQLMQAMPRNASPAMKRVLLTLLPMIQQFEADAEE